MCADWSLLVLIGYAWSLVPCKIIETRISAHPWKFWGVCIGSWADGVQGGVYLGMMAVHRSRGFGRRARGWIWADILVAVAYAWIFCRKRNGANSTLTHSGDTYVLGRGAFTYLPLLRMTSYTVSLTHESLTWYFLYHSHHNDGKYVNRK